MDTELASELVAMASEDEEAVHAFAAQAMTDEALAEDLDEHVGWHPGQDPIAMWRSAHGAPTPVWLVAWPNAHPVVRRLTETISRHTRRLHSIIDHAEWPGRSLVGEEGADAAWFLAMHADLDTELQHRSIELLRDAVAAGEADPRHLATLVDRVSSAAHGVQIYGTLAVRHDHQDVFLVPVEEPHQLDDRRRRLGLPAVSEDLADDGASQLPYRHLRRTPSFQWPPAPGTAP